MADETRSEDVPHNRLTRLCDAMTQTLEEHPEFQGERCAIFIDSDVEQKGGLVLAGYQEDVDAVIAIFAHMKALFRTNGMTLEVFPMQSKGQG